MTITVNEPLTYAPDAPRSYFYDLIRAKAMNDPEASERLERHAAEMRVERAERERRGIVPAGMRQAATLTDDLLPIEYRVAPNSTLGTGGEFDIPLYLVDRFATAGRAGRPFGDLLQPMVLPSGVTSVHTPRINVGTTTADQVDGGAVSNTDFTTVDASSNVVTIAGESVISQQLMDLSPVGMGMDGAILTDLTRAYNKNLETQLLTGSTGGSGSQLSGQLLGVANVTGINTVSGSGVPASGTTYISTLWPLLGQPPAAIGNNRQLPPEYCLMTPRRWFSVASSVDNSLRPIASPAQSSDPSGYPYEGDVQPIGKLFGLPVYLDGTIPAGTSADAVYFLRPSDMFLWESTPRTIVTVVPTSATLQVRISLHKYVAFVPQRYPNGIGVLTALPQPTGY
jgi:Phage capsid family